ncbi:MAG TPA: mandelate racemase/muconate lactonizing enzyme family protein [Planctomycetota bacterium]|nr:mandelate racemase/muconate lactonizing enzyme family protein [Planctomycetota bacterium]
MKIREVEAVWLHCPLDLARQHTSDFGRISAFDGVLVTITTEDGLKGYGEAKPAVGSAGNAAAIVAIVRGELRPQLVGADAREIGRSWGSMYNGTRAPLAERFGRAMPVLGRRGIHVAAMSGVDLALWDLAGKRRGVSVLELVGGAARERIPAYASGGWADAAGIGAELVRYVEQGFRAVKMRIGAMDGGVENSLARVRAARQTLGPSIEIMVDAHGTLNVAQAKQFCAGAASLGLRFVEEPVMSDDRAGLALVRSSSPLAIAAGESEFGCFDFADLIARGAIDVLQPDLAIAGGMSEGLRIAALAYANRLELAPHCWGSAISFQAARTLAFASPAGVFVEVPMGGSPLLREMAAIDMRLREGALLPPTGHGFGVEPDPDFVRKFTQEG